MELLLSVRYHGNGLFCRVQSLDWQQLYQSYKYVPPLPFNGGMEQIQFPKRRFLFGRETTDTFWEPRDTKYNIENTGSKTVNTEHENNY